MIKINRVEQHVIRKNHIGFNIIDSMCFKSKNLYNYANFILRQEFITNKYIPKYNKMAGDLKSSDVYKDLGSNIGQQTLRVLDKNWKSFFSAIKDYSKRPDKYFAKPKIPKYKDKNGRFPLYLDSNKFSIVDNYIRFSLKSFKFLNNIFKTKCNGRPIQIRFIPKGNVYILELVYEIDLNYDCNFESKNILSIDLGVNNLTTCVNNKGLKPFIINGKIIKSMNQYYNKKKAKIQSDLKLRTTKDWSNKLNSLTLKRNNKIKTHLHTISKKIISHCHINNIDTIVIGKNDLWKQEANMSKNNNQKFTHIPYNQLINNIKYKAEYYNIKVIETEESYTSGTSFLDLELPIKENYNKSRRIYRGLFESNKGIKINSDVNGAFQIMKKVFPNAFAEGIEGLDLIPVKVNII